MWCVLTHHTTKDVLLSAVNLGLDTDTTSMVAGGLAGIVHGLDSIPEHWLLSLARKDDIEQLVERFVNSIDEKAACAPHGF